MMCVLLNTDGHWSRIASGSDGRSKAHEGQLQGPLEPVSVYEGKSLSQKEDRSSMSYGHYQHVTLSSCEKYNNGHVGRLLFNK